MTSLCLWSGNSTGDCVVCKMMNVSRSVLTVRINWYNPAIIKLSGVQDSTCSINQSLLDFTMLDVTGGFGIYLMSIR